MVGHGKQRYREIADDLRRRIESGEWRPGEVLTRQEDLATHYGVARNAIAAAIRELETDGLVLSVRRTGTVVLERRTRRLVEKVNRVHRRRERGYSFGSTQPGEPPWEHHVPPSYTWEPIPARPAELLRVEPGILAARRRRVTSPEGEPPYALSDSWILPEVAQAVPQVFERGVPGEYLQFIEEYLGGPLEFTEEAIARPPDAEEARLLKIPMRMWVHEIYVIAVAETYRHSENEPALIRTQTVDVTSRIIPCDRMKTVTKIPRDPSAEWVEVLSPPGGPWSPKEA